MCKLKNNKINILFTLHIHEQFLQKQSHIMFIYNNLKSNC